MAASNIAVEINHIVIPSADKRAAARALANILGLEIEYSAGEMVRTRTSDGLALDFIDSGAAVALQCAFLLTDAEFDAAVGRIRSEAIDYFARFDGEGPGLINYRRGGRGVYFDSIDRHLFELIEENETPPRANRIRAIAVKYAY
jgi:hypothetical protein